MRRGEEESLDDLLLGGMQIFQARKGYRFSIDSVLLAHFPDLHDVSHIIDLGTGNGVIPLLLAYRKPGVQITGIEIQPQMAERARRNMEHNRLQWDISIKCLDIRTLSECYPAAQAELATCNPPFWKHGEGKINNNQEQAIARHEIAVKLPDIIAAAAHALRPQGRLVMIHQAKRLAEIDHALALQGFGVKRFRMVRSFAAEQPKLVLLEACRTSLVQPPIEEPSLTIYQAPGTYSPEINSLYERT